MSVRFQRPTVVLAIGLVTALLAAWLLAWQPSGGADAHGEEEGGGHEESTRGPRGGRLLEEGDLALEITIFERGVPPELRVYAYQDGEPLPPGELELSVELERLGGRVDRISFTPREDHLVGDREIVEPHSFDVRVTARHAGRSHSLAYESHEGRVTVSAAMAGAAGIEVAEAGPARLRSNIALNGRIVTNEDALAHIMPRFSGLAKSVRKRLGDGVEKDELLAVIESNESLHPYEVRSRIAGTVIFKEITPGEFVANDREIYVVADLSTVWADLQVYRRDFGALRVGQRVFVDVGDESSPVETTIAYLSPVGSENTQTLLARAVVPNPDGSWRPGLFVTAQVEVDATDVPVAVRASALQRLRDWDVVFRNEGDVFEAQPVELGRRDGEWVEIVSGLSPGDRYAAAGSFVLKADVGKAGASHDH
jgi:cobalt-zinc-cadmium efflux system membrane fusion protein